MGEHIDSRKKAHKRKKVNEGYTDGSKRHQRVSFKNFIRDLDEELLEQDLEAEDDEEDGFLD